MIRSTLQRTVPAALIAAALAVAGCATAKKPTAAAPTVSAEDALANAKAELGSVARVASVVDTVAAEKRLAIDPASSADFPVGSTISILDGQQNVVGHGEVYESSPSGVYVKYYPKTRDAQKGDVAVRF